MSDEHRRRALEILRGFPLVDGHDDVPWQLHRRVDGHLDALPLDADTSNLEPPMHTDLPRLRAGGVGGQFWALYVPSEVRGSGAVLTLFELLDMTRRLIDRHDDLELAVDADDVERIHGEGRIAALLAIEGGHALGESLAVLRQARALGVRYMTLTHNAHVAWADACCEPPEHGGLTPFGRRVVREMNRIGMLVDISHAAVATMHHALDASRAPVIASHSGARALIDHPRNLPDDVLERIAACGGVAMVTFVPTFVSEEMRRFAAARAAEESRMASLFPADPARVQEGVDAWDEGHPEPRATLADVADHVEHVRDVAGVDHVGIGSDFDGITDTPVGLEDVSTFPDLLAELLERGWSDDDIRRLAGGNLLRVLRDADAVARRLAAEEPPDDARIDDVDD